MNGPVRSSGIDQHSVEFARTGRHSYARPAVEALAQALGTSIIRQQRSTTDFVDLRKVPKSFCNLMSTGTDFGFLAGLERAAMVACEKAGYRQTRVVRRVPPGATATQVEIDCMMQKI